MKLKGMLIKASAAMTAAYKGHNNDPVWLVHIPKTGGTSFKYIMQRQFHHRFHMPRPGSDELCFEKGAGRTYKTMVLFRDPEKHVYSQYLECKHDGWGKAVTKGTGFPRGFDDEDETTGYMPNFELWLNHFKFSKDHFNCYYPYNMQTRYMSCKAGEDGHAYIGGSHIKLRTALDNLHKAWSIGLTSQMAASVCLFRAMEGHLRSGDVCGSKNIKLIHERHGVPARHNIEDLSPEVRQTIQEFIKDDAVLYEAAKRIFLQRIQNMKTYRNITILLDN